MVYQRICSLGCEEGEDIMYFGAFYSRVGEENNEVVSQFFSINGFEHSV